jgi:hypothetical protein
VLLPWLSSTGLVVLVGVMGPLTVQVALLPWALNDGSWSFNPLAQS